MKIALIGDQGSGKTSFFGALHAQYRARQAARMIAKPSEIAIAQANGVHHQVGFQITGYAYSSDRDTLQRIADGMTDRPMRWPPPTEFSDLFPMDVMFEHTPIGSLERTQREKRLALVDVPGGHFSHQRDNDDAAQLDRARVASCEALVIFVDAGDMDIDKITERLDFVEKNIRSIVKGAVDSLTHPLAILPVSVVLTKFDRYPQEKWGSIHDLLFNEIVTQFSDMDAKILLMSCPMSITSMRPNILKPKNIEYPFLFSTLGIVFAQYHHLLFDAEYARITRKESIFKRFFQFVKDGRTIGSMERSAYADLMLAKAILSGIKGDLVLKRADLRFAQSGSEIDIRQLESVL